MTRLADVAGSPGDVCEPLQLGGRRLFADDEHCTSCGVARRRWPVDHPLFSEGGSQCPWCVQADIEDDTKQKRREEG